MCGRFATAFLLPEKLKNYFQLDTIHPFIDSFNIAPSLLIPAIRTIDHERILAPLTWGLIPHWSKELDSKLHLFNARMETLNQKPSFRESFRKKRSIIPASGFYEWQKQGEHKQPFYIQRQDLEPMALAGLWDAWTDPASGEVIESCAIVTAPANAQLKAIHDRMPAILEPEHFDLWLDPNFKEIHVLQNILTLRREVLDLYPVSSYVNNARNDGEACLSPLHP